MPTEVPVVADAKQGLAELLPLLKRRRSNCRDRFSHYAQSGQGQFAAGHHVNSPLVYIPQLFRVTNDIYSSTIAPLTQS